MKVLLVSKALVTPAYQRKAEELAVQDSIELIVVVPPSWRDRRGEQRVQPAHTQGYALHITPVAGNGHFHLHFYPRLGSLLDVEQPDVLHMEEEPYNLATWLALWEARRRNIPACFFTWQNLNRRYPPPFRWFERSCYRSAFYAIAGSHTAARILRAKGYDGALSVIPQFGVDPDHFAPVLNRNPQRPFTIGYAGGLLPEKGVDLLLRAAAQLPHDCHIHLAGQGEAEASLRVLASELGLAQRVTFSGRIESDAMPDFYRNLDVLVLPSLTRRNWREQFGRVLVEAMSCGVPVIGSSSGEIPHVIGDAGLSFPEGDVAALQQELKHVYHSFTLRRYLQDAGRQRVLDHFTHQHVAQATVAVYRQMLGQAPLQSVTTCEHALAAPREAKG